MGRTRATLYLGLGACVVLAGGILVYLGRSSSHAASPAASPLVASPAASPLAASPAATSPTTGPTSSPIATVPAPTGTLGGIAWQPGGPLALQAGGTGMAVIPMGDRLIAFGAVGYAPQFGNLGSAAVWSSTDAVTWRMISKQGAFSTDSAFVRGAVLDGRGGMFAVASRYDIARADALWHSSDGATWTRLTVGNSQVLTNATIAVSNGVAVVTGQALQQSQPERYVWYSSDGVTWTEATLPGAYPDVDGRALITGGVRGFEIVDRSGSGSAWHSDDGRTWLKSSYPGGGTFTGFSATALLATDGSFVVIGFDGGNGGGPLTWTSADGVSWSRSSMEDPGRALGCASGCQPVAVTAVGSALVAVGYQNRNDDTLPASTPIVTWVSMDHGRTWRVRGSGSSGVLPLALTPFGSDVLMFGQPLPVEHSPYDLGFWSVARGSVAWQSAGTAP